VQENKGVAVSEEAGVKAEMIEIPPLELSGADQKRLVLLGDDLDFLAGLPSDRLLTHSEVRTCATILRRLLLDHGNGQLGIVLRQMLPPKGFDPGIEATFIDPVLNRVDPAWVKFAWAGGAPGSAAHHLGMILYRIPEAVWKPHGSLVAFQEAADLPGGPSPKRLLTLKDWLASTSVAIGTEQGLVPISRREVLEYIANKGGGVHFDPTRKLEPTITATSKRQRKHLKEMKFQLLDYAFIWVGHLSGPEYEIASMAHAIGDSGWAAQISKAARESAPNAFNGDPKELRFWDGSDWVTQTFHQADGGT